MLRAGTVLQDRYEILEKIGSGGMSDVYRAKCHKLWRNSKWRPRLRPGSPIPAL